MDALTRHAIGVLLRRQTTALVCEQTSAIVGVYRRPRKLILRGLASVQNALGLEADPNAYAEALPAIARRLREGSLAETGTGWCAVAFLGDAHGPAEASRLGTAVLTDGGIGHLTWDRDESETAAVWRLFEAPAEAVDRWTIGLSMLLAALTGERGRWGGTV
jgi:hypothetical protein